MALRRHLDARTKVVLSGNTASFGSSHIRSMALPGKKMRHIGAAILDARNRQLSIVL